MKKQPNDELVRELYARFGLAYYNSECLHRGLCTIFALATLPQRDYIVKPRVVEQLAYAFTLTFGDVVSKLKGIIPDKYFDQLQEAVNQRNFLAHHFWFERCHLMFDVNHIKQLIVELDKYSEFFNRLDELTSKWYEPIQQELGVTDDIIQQHMTIIMSGQPGEPFPDKQMVKKLNKDFKSQQRLIRVWEFSLSSGGKPLIFETEGNIFWQLCDIGLSQTLYNEKKSDWNECLKVKPYLPANIQPRPKVTKPWEYEFKLGKKAVFWVKPGKKKQTFKWGIRELIKCAK